MAGRPRYIDGVVPDNKRRTICFGRWGFCVIVRVFGQVVGVCAKLFRVLDLIGSDRCCLLHCSPIPGLYTDREKKTTSHTWSTRVHPILDVALSAFGNEMMYGLVVCSRCARASFGKKGRDNYGIDLFEQPWIISAF